jgi:hypothetical protein
MCPAPTLWIYLFNRPGNCWQNNCFSGILGPAAPIFNKSGTILAVNRVEETIETK